MAKKICPECQRETEDEETICVCGYVFGGDAPPKEPDPFPRPPRKESKATPRTGTVFLTASKFLTIFTMIFGFIAIIMSFPRDPLNAILSLLVTIIFGTAWIIVLDEIKAIRNQRAKDANRGPK